MTRCAVAEVALATDKGPADPTAPPPTDTPAPKLAVVAVVQAVPTPVKVTSSVVPACPVAGVIDCRAMLGWTVAVNATVVKGADATPLAINEYCVAVVTGSTGRVVLRR